jgi:anti-anti-sigma factor
MTATIKTQGKISIVTIKYDLTNDHVKSFMKTCNRLIAEERRLRIILNLENVQNISLLGQIAISSIYNHLNAAGGLLKLINLQEKVKRQFEKTNLINTIEHYANEIDAISSFNRYDCRPAPRAGQPKPASFYIKEIKSFVGWDAYPIVGAIQ